MTIAVVDPYKLTSRYAKRKPIQVHLLQTQLKCKLAKCNKPTTVSARIEVRTLGSSGPGPGEPNEEPQFCLQDCAIGIKIGKSVIFSGPLPSGPNIDFVQTACII